jgi:hypothetical protein
MLKTESQLTSRAELKQKLHHKQQQQLPTDTKTNADDTERFCISKT